MSNDKNILIICEGNDEKRLFDILFNIYPTTISYKAYSYGTNIYLLRKYIFENYFDKGFKIDDIDIISLLKEYRYDDVLNQKFTDILLVFDLEPQDPRFNYEDILSMQSIFSESTSQGQLYLNYPMFESFLHFEKLPDLNYLLRKILLSKLPRNGYKNLVRETSIINDLGSIRAENLPILLNQTFEKFRILTENGENDYRDLLVSQILLIEIEKSVWVINTSVLFLRDYNQNLFLEYIVS